MIVRLRLSCNKSAESSTVRGSSAVTAVCRDEDRVFREYLGGEGLRLTSERITILREVFSRHDHFEAEDIVMGLRGRGTRVSRASVYRTLPLLVECGLLRCVHLGEKHGHYEHTYGHEHHDHMICSRCGRTIEFKDDEIERLQDRVCAAHAFAPDGHRLEISGVCAECAGGSPDGESRALRDGGKAL